ncbi:MAG: alpha/beta hydrolase [Betaproteobacteria bacterium]|jgi:pimeloyl-ACP methyl ester carboxylesterase|nr:alpha/beta hydrolase [Burkholderiales bacterium]NBX91237.1 alpha/beta hydrolase [Betaproteobacteria bacterium]
MTPIIFSHGNSFPASTYRVVLESLRNRGFHVSAIEKLGHNPAYPVTSNWPHLVQELADFATQQMAQTGAPAFLVGHSLGGMLSLMCAAKHPRLARGVLLLDSPIVTGWRAGALNLAKKTQWIGSVSPGRLSRTRRQHWPDVQAVYDHFRHKRAFAHWQDEVLQDYAAHGTLEENGARVLSFDRAIETAIYNTLPHNMSAMIKKHPVKCPVAFIGGTHSREMRLVGMEMTHQMSKGRVMMLDGSHLFPMEKPEATAAAMEAALRNLMP